jgi:hypothetical protein
MPAKIVFDKQTEKKIIKMYVKEDICINDISRILNTNKYYISKLLKENSIIVKKRSRKGVLKTRIESLKNMAGNLKYDVTLEWLIQFDNIKKLRYLNLSITHRINCSEFNTEMYISFIEKFYYDKKFNTLYDKWIETGNKWIKPSLDHIIPRSKGGLSEINNYQFISWLENKAKFNMDQSEWNKFKKRINEYF